VSAYGVTIGLLKRGRAVAAADPVADIYEGDIDVQKGIDKQAYREAKQREAREQVERSVRALLTSEGWQRWAQTRATFHRYSMGNCMLIAMQRPEATQVAGFRAWQQLGRQVRKGEKAIHILAPMVVGGSREERAQARSAGITMQPTASDKMPDESVRVLFRGVSVFDVAQTDGEPLPEPPREAITGSSHECYLAPLKNHARSLGIAVYEYEPTSEAQGFYDEKGARIVISTELAPNGKVRTLVHELAHAHGVTYKEYSRGEAEVIVETAATIVCGSLGLDTSGESIPYIAGWGESGDLGAIRKHASTVDEIARSIEHACYAMAEKLEAEARGEQ
jgi:antirestriction protein ArdC